MDPDDPKVGLSFVEANLGLYEGTALPFLEFSLDHTPASCRCGTSAFHCQPGWRT